MTKRLLMGMALAMFAGLALPTPSHAGSILTEATVDTTTGGNISDFTIVYNVPITAGSIAFLPSTTVTVTGTTYTATGVTITFTAVTAPPVEQIDFTLATPSSGPFKGISSEFSGTFSSETGGVAVSNASVPEPASLALLGIGMTGFLAFRRYFKKTSVA